MGQAPVTTRTVSANAPSVAITIPGAAIAAPSTAFTTDTRMAGRASVVQTTPMMLHALSRSEERTTVRMRFTASTRLIGGLRERE